VLRLTCCTAARLTKNIRQLKTWLTEGSDFGERSKHAVSGSSVCVFLSADVFANFEINSNIITSKI
jgi:hypothetical protein